MAVTRDPRWSTERLGGRLGESGGGREQGEEVKDGGRG